MDFTTLRTRIVAAHSEVNDKGQVITPVLVRVPAEGDQELRWIIKQTLEAGAYGIVVPHVSTAEQATKIVSAARFPQRPDSKYPFPPGIRGHGCGFNCGPRTWELRMDAYMRLADPWPLNPDGELFIVVMIESDEGVANINEILDVPGISAVDIGPSDLSTEITGRPFRAWHWPDNEQPAQVKAAIATVLAACKAKNKICGMHVQTGHGSVADEAQFQQYLAEGWRMLAAPRTLPNGEPRGPCTKKAPQCF